MTDRARRALELSKLAIASALAAAVVGACGSGDGAAAGRADAAAPTPGAQPADAGSRAPLAPDFTLKPVRTPDPIRLSDYKGKVVLIDFWATWCGPCRASIPHLNALYEEHKDSGFEVLGVSVDQGRSGVSGSDVVAAFAKRVEMKYPLAMANAEIVNAYGGIRSIPTAFLIDRSGRVRQKYVGLRPKSAYEKDITALLDEAPEPGTI